MNYEILLVGDLVNEAYHDGSKRGENKMKLNSLALMFCVLCYFSCDNEWGRHSWGNVPGVEDTKRKKTVGILKITVDNIVHGLFCSY